MTFPLGGDTDAGAREFARSRPVLEIAVSRPSAVDRLHAAAVSGLVIGFPPLLIGAVIGGFHAVFGDGFSGRDVASLAVIAGVLALWGAVFGFALGGGPVSAYGSALAVADGNGRAVELYELVTVAVRRDRNGTRVLLSGPPGSLVELPLGLVEGNPELWDLVHHGVRHSVAAGATIDDATVRLLRLDDDPVPAPTRPAAPAVVVPAGVPPEPDARGVPRPPRAPEVASPWRGRRRPKEHLAEPAPDEVRPTLVTLRARRRHGRGRAAVHIAADSCLPQVVLLVLAVCAIVLFVDGPNMSGALVFFGWTLAIGFGCTVLLYWFDRRSMTLLVGARHLCDDVGDAVDLYDLAAVRVRRTVRAGPVLVLTGHGGGRIGVPLGLLVASPAAWDLVYLGLVHAQVRGARIDARTRAALFLPTA